MGGGALGTVLAVANRKGGVGKSTIACMLAHGFAALQGRSVLVVDLDAQTNASLILIGGERWKALRDAQMTVSDYFEEFFDKATLSPGEYVLADATDVRDADGMPAPIALACGSLRLEDVEHFMLHSRAANGDSLVRAEAGVRGRFARMLREFNKNIDVLLFDCPPGLSLASQAALHLADKILVPLRPDYVSTYAVDRISMLIEGKGGIDKVFDIPFSDRRYCTVINFWKENGPNRTRLAELEIDHPLLQTKIPQMADVGHAFQWQPNLVTFKGKYRGATTVVEQLTEEVADWLELPPPPETAASA